MRRARFFSLSLLILNCLPVLRAQEAAPLRPPAIPLVVHDPYFSIWANSDLLTGKSTVHWTGTDQAITGLVRIDGVVYRFLGDQPRGANPVQSLKQVSFKLTPTRTFYIFEGGGIQLDFTFMTPALALAVFATRFGNLSAGERASLWRRRG